MQNKKREKKSIHDVCWLESSFRYSKLKKILKNYKNNINKRETDYRSMNNIKKNVN